MQLLLFHRNRFYSILFFFSFYLSFVSSVFDSDTFWCVGSMGRSRRQFCGLNSICTRSFTHIIRRRTINSFKFLFDSLCMQLVSLLSWTILITRYYWIAFCGCYSVHLLCHTRALALSYRITRTTTVGLLNGFQWKWCIDLALFLFFFTWMWKTTLKLLHESPLN